MSREIRPPHQSPYTGMTVNERLVLAGLLDDFDKAAYAKNEEGIRAILAKVDLGDESANEIIDWVKNSPHSPYRS